MIGDNAALIAGLGVAIGAIIAASLPHTAAEAAVIGKASGGVKRAAGKAVQSGFDSAKEAVLSAGHAAEKSMSQADLGKAASHMNSGYVRKIKGSSRRHRIRGVQSFSNRRETLMSEFRFLASRVPAAKLDVHAEGPNR